MFVCYCHLDRYEERLRLESRNEGKIKSYKSSLDLRSWSHDADRRSQYLQEWMKSDMPISVLPVHILAHFLNTMTCRSRRKVTPKCHPDCKSKLILDSIRNSCHAMQECMKNNNAFNSYFQEEEFETCNWPCERCLEVLKNIKMFWKVIVDKIFNINFSKATVFSRTSSMRLQADTIHSVAKMWENEIVEQAAFVNKIVPLTKKSPDNISSDLTKDARLLVQNHIAGDCKALHTSTPKCSLGSKKSANTTKTSDKILLKKVTRSTSVKIQMVDVETNTTNTENEEAKEYKHKAINLQNKISRQVTEMEYLKKENYSLKFELENFYENTSRTKPFLSPLKVVKPIVPADSNDVLPMPFESCADITSNDASAKEINSEMIITMRNCRNENFKHISLLQVLHKTNKPTEIINSINKSHYSKENPIELLTKVQNTFGELMRREMEAIKNVNITSNNSEITASFCRADASRSESSCTSCTTVNFSSKINTSCSESHFVSL